MISSKINILQNLGLRLIYKYSNGNTKPPYPRVIALPVIAQCNHRCIFCEIQGVEKKLKQDGNIYQTNIMTVNQVKAYETFLKHASVIDFGGLTALGEPLLTPHFQEIVRYIRSINPDVSFHITTNAGLLTKEKSEFLKNQAPLHVTFSLHAITKEIYERTMGKDFDNVIRNITYFCRITKGNEQITKSINFGLGKHNYTDAEAIVDFAKEQGIDTINIYPYYKSQNSFMEDVSLYGDPDLANRTLDKVYEKAEALGQNMKPKKPSYITPPLKTSVNKKKYQGGCSEPFNHFILKADPFTKNKLALCICNRIVLFQVDLEKPITIQDLNWAWNHPAIKALRLATIDTIPTICKFCKDAATPSLRSLDYEKYKEKRDRAVFKFLKQFHKDTISPNQSITLLSDNIYSL